MASRPSSTVLPGVITSLCLDTVSARMGVGHMGVNALKILMGSHLSFFPFPPFPRDSVSVIAEVQRFHGALQVKHRGVRTTVTLQRWRLCSDYKSNWQRAGTVSSLSVRRCQPPNVTHDPTGGVSGLSALLEEIVAKPSDVLNEHERSATATRRPPQSRNPPSLRSDRQQYVGRLTVLEWLTDRRLEWSHNELRSLDRRIVWVWFVTDQRRVPYRSVAAHRISFQLFPCVFPGAKKQSIPGNPIRAWRSWISIQLIKCKLMLYMPCSYVRSSNWLYIQLYSTEFLTANIK